MNLVWVTIGKCSELTGYTQEAIRQKIKKGVWVQGRHWRKAPDNRIFIDISAVYQWVSGYRA